MDKINVKTTGVILSIAILLITSREKVTSLQVNPASNFLALGRFFQQLFEGVNFQLSNNTWFCLIQNTVIHLLLNNNLIFNTNPARAYLIGNTISGTGLTNNFPVCNQTCRIHSRQPAVISNNTVIINQEITQ